MTTQEIAIIATAYVVVSWIAGFFVVKRIIVPNVDLDMEDVMRGLLIVSFPAWMPFVAIAALLWLAVCLALDCFIV